MIFWVASQPSLATGQGSASSKSKPVAKKFQYADRLIGVPNPFEGMMVRRNSAENQRSGHASQLDRGSKKRLKKWQSAKETQMQDIQKSEERSCSRWLHHQGALCILLFSQKML